MRIPGAGDQLRCNFGVRTVACDELAQILIKQIAARNTDEVVVTARYFQMIREECSPVVHKSRRSNQRVGHDLTFVRIAVCEELRDFGRCRNAPCEVQIDTAMEFRIARLRRRGNAVCGHFSEYEIVDEVRSRSGKLCRRSFLERKGQADLLFLELGPVRLALRGWISWAMPIAGYQRHGESQHD